jgi:hypothetical protein
LPVSLEAIDGLQLSDVMAAQFVPVIPIRGALAVNPCCYFVFIPSPVRVVRRLGDAEQEIPVSPALAEHKLVYDKGLERRGDLVHGAIRRGGSDLDLLERARDGG